MVEKLNLSDEEFRERMTEFARGCLGKKVLAETFLGTDNSYKKRVVTKRAKELSHSLIEYSSYKVDEISLADRKRYLTVLAYFGF